LGHAIAGAAGSAVSNVATYPLKLIVIRMQTQRIAAKIWESRSRAETNDPRSPVEYTSIPDAARKIYRNGGGLGGFYVGLAQDTGKSIADSFILFLAYSFLRKCRLKAQAGLNGRKQRVLPVFDELAIGIIASAFARFLTTPFANIVTRKQTASIIGESDISSTTTRHIAYDLYSEKGIAGFWSGYSASIILTLNPSLMFFLNEFLRHLLVPRRNRAKVSPVLTFLIAATSKALASSLTYPVFLVKTRTQAYTNGAVKDDSSKREESSSDDDDEQRTGSIPFTIFTTLQGILLEEGIGALYDRLAGEVLTGFLTHGIAVLTKDVVHSAVIQSCYTLLFVMRRYPSPEELIQRVHGR
jgi:hypothetical protein